MRMHSFVTIDFKDKYLKQLEYFNEVSSQELNEELIDETIQRCDNREELRLFSYYGASSSFKTILLFNFLLGTPLADNKSTCEQILKAQALMRGQLPQFSLDMGEKIDLNNLEEIGLFLLYSIATGFDDQARQAFALGIPSGVDRCVDMLLKPYQPDRDMAEKPRNPRMFKPLLKIMEAAPEQRAALAKQYLEKWEERIKKGLHPSKHWECHADPDSNFTGFWCFPLAAVVAAYNIDDREFIDHEYYPKDLMVEVAKYRGEPVVIETQGAKPLPPAPQEVPDRVPMPTGLKPFSLITQRLLEPLPDSLQAQLHNALVVSYQDEDMEWPTPLTLADYVDCLAEGHCLIDLYQDYGRILLLSVDWKDTEEATIATETLAKTHHLPAFEVSEEARSVGDILTEFKDWVEPQGYNFYCVNGKDDHFRAFIAPQDQQDELMAAIANLDG